MLLYATLSVLAVVVIAASRNDVVPQPRGALWPPFPDLERTTELYDPR